MLQIRGVKGEAVVSYREPLTSLRQGFGPAGNKGDAGRPLESYCVFSQAS